MKIFLSVLVNIGLWFLFIDAASVSSLNQNGVYRVKRDEDIMGAGEDMMDTGVEVMVGSALSFMDAVDGGAAQDERDSETEAPSANVKDNQTTAAGAGDAIGEDDRRSKRSPCGGKKKGKKIGKKVEPTPADDVAERRKRQTVNDPDNVRPQFDGKTAIQSFLDSFVELAKKIGSLFVPTDPGNSQTRQQEMDDRY